MRNSSKASEQLSDAHAAMLAAFDEMAAHFMSAAPERFLDQERAAGLSPADAKRRVAERLEQLEETFRIMRAEREAMIETVQ